MGSAITSTIVNTTPMFSTMLAMLLLGERPGPLVLGGVGLIVAGLAIISWEGAGRWWKRTELIFPFLAALLFSFKDVTVRWGLGGSGSPVLAAAIAAATSTVEIFLINRYVHAERFTLPPKRVIHWFVSSGLFTGGSFLFMFLALSMERVSIIAPLINSYAVFVLVLAPLMARQIERVTLRKAAGAVLVVAGIFLISAGRN
jgi:drug/metabolite transporter (DMT)-like permease